MTAPKTQMAVGGHQKQIGLTIHSHFVRQLPALIADNLEPCLAEALKPLAASEWKWNDVFWVTRPGNWEIMNAIEAKLGLEQRKLRSSRHVFREYGNMMSAFAQ